METIVLPSGFVLHSLEYENNDPPYVIPDEKSYRHTKNTVAGLQRGLERYRAGEEGSHLGEAKRQLMMDALQSLIDEWSEQMREYERLKNGPAILEVTSLRELPAVLVKARLAAGMTQKQLAQKLGVAPQQIQRYEATRYRTITLARMQEIAEALGVRVEAKFGVG